MAEQYPDQEFVEYAVKAVVDRPEEVKTERTVDEMGVLITLNVHKDDMGAVIGKSGATARALRTLLRVVGAKNNARVNLKINEPEGGRGPRRDYPRGGERERTSERESRTDEAKKRQSIDEVVDELKL